MRTAKTIIFIDIILYHPYRGSTHNGFYLL